MKKILSLILAMLMVLGLAACGNETADQPSAESSADASSEIAYAEKVTVAIDVLPSSYDPGSNTFPHYQPSCL